MTGFTDTERYLGRLVMLAVSKGTPEEAFGLGGMRTVGPAVTYQFHGYTVNGERGVVLGKSFKQAKQCIREIYASSAKAGA